MCFMELSSPVPMMLHQGLCTEVRVRVALYVCIIGGLAFRGGLNFQFQMYFQTRFIDVVGSVDWKIVSVVSG